MRSLPWLTNSDKEEDYPKPSLKRKRNSEPEIQIPETAEDTPEIVETTDSEENLDSSSDNAFDAMIPGYDNDDAYIMVEQDLVEAARQVTRHIHHEAYQKHMAAPVPADQIIRPIIGAPKRRREVTEESEEGEDLSTLGQLLRRRPPAALVAATPIRRKQKSPHQDRGIERKTIEPSAGIQITSRNDNRISGEPNIKAGLLREETKDNATDEETDGDDEDLERRPKVWPFLFYLHFLTHIDQKIHIQSTKTFTGWVKLAFTTCTQTSANPWRLVDQ